MSVILLHQPGRASDRESSTTIALSYHQAAGRLRQYTEQLLRAWLTEHPLDRPEDAEVVIDTSDREVCRISISHRRRPAP